jgi:hypothetical protein
MHAPIQIAGPRFMQIMRLARVLTRHPFAFEMTASRIRNTTAYSYLSAMVGSTRMA